MRPWGKARDRGRAGSQVGGGQEAREAGEAQIGGAPSAHGSPHFCGPRQRDLAKGFRFTHCDSRRKLRESFLWGTLGGEGIRGLRPAPLEADDQGAGLENSVSRSGQERPVPPP